MTPRTPESIDAADVGYLVPLTARERRIVMLALLVFVGNGDDTSDTREALSLLRRFQQETRPPDRLPPEAPS